MIGRCKQSRNWEPALAKPNKGKSGAVRRFFQETGRQGKVGGKLRLGGGLARGANRAHEESRRGAGGEAEESEEGDMNSRTSWKARHGY
jgi:hypothetical protein